jgi:hypothetical protein
MINDMYSLLGAYFVSLNVREAMGERVKESHEPSQEP